MKLQTLILLCLVFATPVHGRGGLRAGYAEADISLGPSLTPFGYDFRAERTSPGNTGVHDPLRCRVLALSDAALPDKPLVVISLDFCVIPSAMLNDRERVVVEEKSMFGIEAQRAWIAR